VKEFALKLWESLAKVRKKRKVAKEGSRKSAKPHYGLGIFLAEEPS